MALEVEDGTGKVNAEAYVSVNDATTYLSARGHGDAWDAIDDKEAALRLAADFMQQSYRQRWAGQRASLAQALDWPRAYVPIFDSPGGYAGAPAYVGISTIPAEVKNANALLALKTANGTLMADYTQKVLEKTVGPISVKYDAEASPFQEFRSIDALLMPYFTSGNNVVRLNRV